MICWQASQNIKLKLTAIPLHKRVEHSKPNRASNIYQGVPLLNSKAKDYRITEFESMLFVEDNMKWTSLVKDSGDKTK